MASQQGFHRDLDHRFLQRAATFPAALKRSSNESHDYDSDELPYLMERLAVPAGLPVPHRILPVTARHSLEAAIGNVLAQTGMHSNVQLRRPSTDPSQSSSTSAHTHRRHRSHDQSTAYVSTYHYIPVVVPLFTDIRPVSSPYENNGTSSLGADGSSGPQRSLPGGVAQAPSIVASHQSSRRYTTQGHNSMPYPHANNAVTPRGQDLEPAHRLADYRCFHNHVFETSGSVASDLSEREYESHILGSDCDSTVSSE